MVLVASVAGVNAAISVTLTAQAGHRHQLYQVTWSYSAAPTSGRVFTEGLEGDELDYDITAGGPGGLQLPPCDGRYGEPVTVTLAAGGSGVGGKLNLFYNTL